MDKILVVGDFHSNIHEKAIYESLVKMEYFVDQFSWHQYFGSAVYLRDSYKLKYFLQLWLKIQYHFAFGPIISKMNKDLLDKVKNNNFNLIFIYRGTHILPKTLKEIKKTGAIIFGYNNDDPFSKKYPFYFWRHFLSSIFLYDYIFSYRHKNIADYKNMAYKNTSLLRSYYIKKDNYHIDLLSSDKYRCDVIFIGHFEDDGRDEYIKTLLDAGINFKLFGPEWQKSKHYKYFVKKMGPIVSLRDDYNLAINSSKIALVFLSHLNNDTYTRRVFEIVAARTLMLATATDDLKSLFKEGVEADYFKSKEELLEKVNFYLSNSEARIGLVSNAYKRLIDDGHEVSDRVKDIIKVYNRIKYEKNLNT